ncbi:MAG: thioesterase [Clostridiales bacterium]|nr:thioesterase [Clostridiales bacterium]
MYCHSKNYEIRYTDVDLSDNLKLSSLLSLMEESACLSAEELGFGYSVLQPKNIGFIMVNWYIEMNRAVKLGDLLTVNTWPIKPKRLIVLRDFELYVGSEKVGVATSRWCVVDLAAFRMLPSSAALDENLQYNDMRSVDVANIKVPDCEAGKLCYSKVVSYSDYDHYNHVNNTKYADFLLDAFTVDEMRGKNYSNVKITYVKQSKEGEVLDFYRAKLDDGSWVVEGKVADDKRVLMQITLYD